MRRERIVLACAALLLAACMVSGTTGPLTQASEQQLEQWLRQFPAADANRDGKLTFAEAEAYRQKLQGESSGQPGFPHEYTFATVSDGVRIALAVGFPKGFDPKDNARKWPALFSTCGYPGAVVPMDPMDRYVTVNASIRGTGASGGALAPFSPRTWQDGCEVIEGWIAKQAWSNGKVGIVGHSWPGLMGFLTATTNPPSVKAVAVSGLIDDFYRGISYVGGVRNCGFPVAWLNSFYHTDGVFGSDAAARMARGVDEAAFQEILKGRPGRDLAQDLLWLSLQSPFDGPAWQESSLATHAGRIRAPIHIGHEYQDEQTGPTGWRLWNRIADGVPKRLVLSNGTHRPPAALARDRQAWLDYWLRGEGDKSIADPATRVRCHFETPADPSAPGSAPLAAAEFPLPQTRWTPLYLRASRVLSLTPPDGPEPPDAYTAGSTEPDEPGEWVEYALEFREPTAICGPANLTLWAELATLDTDFYALLLDRDPQGRLRTLQRGMLRASHRKLDPARSDYATQGGAKLLVGPYHPHDAAELVVPHRAYEYQIGIFAVGHVFRPGHQLVLRVSRPPLGDPVNPHANGEPSYLYVSDRPPGRVALLHDVEHPSSLLLPVLPALPPVPPDAPRPGSVAGVHGLTRR